MNPDLSIPLQTPAEQAAAIDYLSSLASRRIDIFSYQLEPEWYDKPAFIENCKAMLIRHPQCRMRIMIQNNENLKSMDHRLLPLLHRLPSRIELKRCHADEADFRESFMLVDDSGIFLKRTPGRTAAMATADQRRLSDEYQRFFQAAWDKGQRETSLQRLNL